MGTVKLPFYARLALTLLAVALIVMILMVGRALFIPLVFALLIAILLYPVNKLLEYKLRLGKEIAPFVSVFLFVGAMFGFVYFLILQFINFAGDFPQLKKRFQEMFAQMQHWLSHKMSINSSQQTDYINRTTDTILNSVGQSMRSVFFSVTGVLLMLVFVCIFTFFILYYRRLLMKFVSLLFSERHRAKVNEVILETKSMINAYVLGLMIEMVLLCIVNCTIFLIMGIKYPLLLGAMAALLNVIPYLGIYTAILISMLVTFANSTGNVALAVGIALLIVHLLDANILFPRIIGGRVKMNPFITIITVIVGEYIWGVPGMFLFIPIVGIIKLVCQRVVGLEAWGYLIGVEEHDAAVPEDEKVDVEVAPKEKQV